MSIEGLQGEKLAGQSLAMISLLSVQQPADAADRTELRRQPMIIGQVEANGCGAISQRALHDVKPDGSARVFYADILARLPRQNAR